MNNTETGTRPSYAQRGTLWLDTDVPGATSTIKMFTGLADAILFVVDDNSGEAKIRPQRIDFYDPTNDTTASIRLDNENLEFWPQDSSGTTEDRQMVVNDSGITVEGKLNIGYGSAGNANALSISPNVDDGVLFQVTSPTGVAYPALSMQSVDVNPFGGTNPMGVISGGSQTQDFGILVSGVQAVMGFPDTGTAGNSGQLFFGNFLVEGISYLGSEDPGGGLNSLQLMINRHGPSTGAIGDYIHCAQDATPLAYVDAAGGVWGTGPYNIIGGAPRINVTPITFDAQAAVMAIEPETFQRTATSPRSVGFDISNILSALPHAVSTVDKSIPEETIAEWEARKAAAVTLGEDPNLVALRPAVSNLLETMNSDSVLAVLLEHVKNLTNRLEVLEP